MRRDQRLALYSESSCAAPRGRPPKCGQPGRCSTEAGRSSAVTELSSTGGAQQPVGRALDRAHLKPIGGFTNLRGDSPRRIEVTTDENTCA